MLVKPPTTMPTPLMTWTSRLMLTWHLQLRFLVKWGLADVEDASQHAGPFQLLRAVIGRQIVIPEVYDVMKGVQELMVRAQVYKSRPECLLSPQMSLRTGCSPDTGCWSSR